MQADQATATVTPSTKPNFLELFKSQTELLREARHNAHMMLDNTLKESSAFLEANKPAEQDKLDMTNPEVEAAVKEAFAEADLIGLALRFTDTTRKKEG